MDLIYLILLDAELTVSLESVVMVLLTVSSEKSVIMELPMVPLLPLLVILDVNEDVVTELLKKVNLVIPMLLVKLSELLAELIVLFLDVVMVLLMLVRNAKSELDA